LAVVRFDFEIFLFISITGIANNHHRRNWSQAALFLEAGKLEAPIFVYVIWAKKICFDHVQTKEGITRVSKEKSGLVKD